MILCLRGPTFIEPLRQSGVCLRGLVVYTQTTGPKQSLPSWALGRSVHWCLAHIQKYVNHPVNSPRHLKRKLGTWICLDFWQLRWKMEAQILSYYFCHCFLRKRKHFYVPLEKQHSPWKQSCRPRATYWHWFSRGRLHSRRRAVNWALPGWGFWEEIMVNRHHT